MPAPPTMYELLVPDPDDVFAALAYATYKRHELEALAAIASATGAAPTQSDIDAVWHDHSPQMLSLYEDHAETLVNDFVEEALQARKSALESEFATTTISQQLQLIQNELKKKRSWKGWAADVSGNLAVNFASILVIAGLLFGFRGLDQILRDFARNSGALTPEASPAAKTKVRAPDNANPPTDRSSVR